MRSVAPGTKLCTVDALQSRTCTTRSQTAMLRLIATLMLTLAVPAGAEEIGCATTAWKLIGANHRVCVYAYDDPDIAGVTCHISQARTGGVKGSFGLAEDPSQFSLACRQVGPITLPAKLPEEKVVFSEDTSLMFKETRITRFIDRKRNVLIYLALSRKIIDGAPANSISTVPLQPWPGN
jgi:CreA protein